MLSLPWKMLILNRYVNHIYNLILLQNVLVAENAFIKINYIYIFKLKKCKLLGLDEMHLETVGVRYKV